MCRRYVPNILRVNTGGRLRATKTLFEREVSSFDKLSGTLRKCVVSEEASAKYVTRDMLFFGTHPPGISCTLAEPCFS